MLLTFAIIKQAILKINNAEANIEKIQTKVTQTIVVNLPVFKTISSVNKKSKTPIMTMGIIYLSLLRECVIWY